MGGDIIMVKDKVQGKLIKGCWYPIAPEIKEYQEKSAKWDKYMALVKEQNKCRSRIKQIGQELSKLRGEDAKADN